MEKCSVGHSWKPAFLLPHISMKAWFPFLLSSNVLVCPDHHHGIFCPFHNVLVFYLYSLKTPCHFGEKIWLFGCHNRKIIPHSKQSSIFSIALCLAITASNFFISKNPRQQIWSRNKQSFGPLALTTHAYTKNSDGLSFSSGITVSLMFTQGSNYCWCQEDTVDYALKICPMSPHFTTQRHNSSQNLEESSLSFLHIPYQTCQQIMLPLNSKIYSEPTNILVEIIRFPYTWATRKASGMPLLWPLTHSYPPQTSNCESDHISSSLGSRECLIPALITLCTGSPSSPAAAPGAEFPLRPYFPAYTLHQALLASWSLLIQPPLFQMPLQSLHGSFQLNLQS